jgi:hypothetical protein
MNGAFQVLNSTNKSSPAACPAGHGREGKEDSKWQKLQSSMNLDVLMNHRGGTSIFSVIIKINSIINYRLPYSIAVFNFPNKN